MVNKRVKINFQKKRAKLNEFKKKAKINKISSAVSNKSHNLNRKMLGKDLMDDLKVLDRSISRIDKEIDHEAQEIENWVVERRKFFIKLGWVALFVLVLFIISELYLTTNLG